MNQNSLAGYKLVISKQAEKDLSKIETGQVQLIRKRINELVSDHQSLDVKKMTGNYTYPTYRLRSGDYRIIYQVQKQEVVVLVVKIGHRREIYERRGRYE